MILRLSKVWLLVILNSDAKGLLGQLAGSFENMMTQRLLMKIANVTAVAH
jgi:hypothetical protein